MFDQGMTSSEISPHVNFQASSFLPQPHQGVKAMLQNVDDLLFVLNDQGQILNCKSRSGSVLNTHALRGVLSMEDLLPSGIQQKYKLAIERYKQTQEFTLFESMLILPSDAVNWYEFRLIPALQGQTVLFIWNVNDYRRMYWTVPNAPISIENMIEGWLRSLYLRDFETEVHTRRVTEMALQLAQRLGVSEGELANIRRGAQVHDIGKIAIPDEILLKTGALTEPEWDVMRQHPLIAVAMLEAIPQIGAALHIPRWHHEKWDGSGYPDGLAGEDIPLAARIFAFADVYDALTSDRPYRCAWSRTEALTYIRNESGRHFDPFLTPEFIRLQLE